MRQLADRELFILRELEAIPTSNSGASFQNADGTRPMEYPLGNYQWDRLVIEVKATEKKSFSVTQNIWQKLVKDASSVRGMPVLAVDLNKQPQLVILRLSDFTDILDQMRDFQIDMERLEDEVEIFHEMENQITDLQNEISRLEDDVTAEEAENSGKQLHIDELEEEIDNLKEQLAEVKSKFDEEVCAT